MKKICLLILFCFIQSICYADDCFVIGFHQSGSDIYNGPTFCKKIKMNNITVYGPLRIIDSIIQKNIIVSGPIDSMQSTLGNITIKPQFISQVITLKNTLITGDIQFLGKSGTVVIDGKSKIEGRVINGRIKS